MFYTKGNGLTRMNLCSLLQRWSFMQENLCCVYGGITAVILTFKCRLILSTAAACVWKSSKKMPCTVALYGWPEQTIPLSVLARNQTKDFWTWNLAVSGSGKGTQKRVGWTKELAGSWWRDSREASQQKSWRGTTDRGSQHPTPETVAEKRGSSHDEEDRLKIPAFQLLCGIFASNPH